MTVNSRTAALHLALEAVGVGTGDEVITSPITFASTANVIVHRGARPVFVDVESDTLNIDAAAVDAAVTPRTNAVIPVDFAGQPCDLEAIMAVGAHRGLLVIEDAAHVIGAAYKGRRVGGIADVTGFSFYATKNITSGEGGALTTDRDTIMNTIRPKTSVSVFTSAPCTCTRNTSRRSDSTAACF